MIFLKMLWKPLSQMKKFFKDWESFRAGSTHFEAWGSFYGGWPFCFKFHVLKKISPRCNYQNLKFENKTQNPVIITIIIRQASLHANWRALIGSEAFFPVHYFPETDHGPKRVILQSNVNKLRKVNSKGKKKRKQKTNIYKCESKEKHSENSLTIRTIQFSTIYFLLKKTTKTRKKASFLSGQIIPYYKTF